MGKIINNALRHRRATGRTCMHLLSLACNCIKRLQMQTQNAFACFWIDLKTDKKKNLKPQELWKNLSFSTHHIMTFYQV
jgi:hypothetical protein